MNTGEVRKFKHRSSGKIWYNSLNENIFECPYSRLKFTLNEILKSPEFDEVLTLDQQIQQLKERLNK